MSDRISGEKSVKDASPLNRYEALAILYLQKQDLDDCSPEEVVTRYIEAHNRIIKEFSRQKDVRKRLLNPMPI
ncbi:MAG: hypothetical protein GX847_02360 [Clostridiales bacterium]|nr:hypothetical protein [Clostridiales bacterium]